MHHLRKAPANMWIPLVILALFSVAVGFVGVTPEHGVFYNFLGHNVPHGAVQKPNAPLKIPMALLPLGVAVAGIGLAYLSYAQWWDLPGRFSTLYVLLFRRYFVDEIYYAIFLDRFRRLCHRLWEMDGRIIDGAVNRVAALNLSLSDISSRGDEKVIDGAVNRVADIVVGSGSSFSVVDEKVIDGAVNKVADLNQGLARILRRLQTGLIHNYLLVMALGIFLVASLFMIFR